MRQKGTSWVLAALLGMLTAIACGGGRQTAQEAPKPSPGPRIVKPVTTDGEIFYFPVIGDDYRASLSDFRKAHPELRCRYFGPEDKTVNGDTTYPSTHIVGHTLVCTDTAENAQEETIP